MRGLTALSIITACLMATSSQASHYKSSELMAFPQSVRDAFIAGSFMSIGHVATLKDKEQGKCIWDWYFLDPDSKTTELEAAMRKYPDTSPTAIFIGKVQQNCGTL